MEKPVVRPREHMFCEIGGNDGAEEQVKVSGSVRRAVRDWNEGEEIFRGDRQLDLLRVCMTWAQPEPAYTKKKAK